MASYTIGVHDGHNAAAAIQRDGKLLYAIQEERLARKKNWVGFPKQSVQACLDYAGIGPQDVEELSFASLRQTPNNLRSYDQLASVQRSSSLYGIFRGAFLWFPIYKAHKNMGWRERLNFAKEMGFSESQCERYAHHLCHAATAYYGMREDHDSEYLVLTMDGYGDEDCATVSIGRGGRLETIARTPLGHSLGTIYAITTGMMGFRPLEHEYKLMGMAPYANPSYAEDAAAKFRTLLGVDMDKLQLRRKTPEPTFLMARRIKSMVSCMRFDNVVAGLQQHCEEVMMDFVRAAIQKTGIRRVLAAGGVFMNVKANKRIMEMPEVDYFSVAPSAGDESMSMGVAWHAYAKRHGYSAAANIEPLGALYLGDLTPEEKIDQAVRESGFKFTRFDDVEKEVAELLAAGQPVARCKGRMEFGARALGNRSILADPKNQDIVRIINRMVKKRDFWMPFAPVIRKERVGDYFHNPKDLSSPYMMLSFDTFDNYKDLIAAVHNADLTARAQILEQDHNPDYYKILEYFENKTGRSVLLNTSFNLHGYPIVMEPEESIDVFRRTGLEYLNVGQYILQKDDAPIELS